MFFHPKSKIGAGFVALLLTLWLSPAQAEDPQKSNTYEARAVHSFLLHCLPALTIGQSVQHAAEMQKLPELPASAEAVFLKGKPGKVFGLPEVGAGVILATPDSPMCSVLIKKLDQKEFIKQLDVWFDPKHTPFEIKENDTLDDGEIRREYTTNTAGTKILIIVKVRTESRDDGAQAMLIAGTPNDL